MSSAKCVICTDEFPGIDDLEAHISADHYNCLPFECEKCKFAKFPTEFAIKRHYEEDHGLVEYFIRYRVSREIYEKKQKVRECLERCIRHSDVSSGQHQIALANSRNIIAGDYPPSSSAHSSHYQSRQLHESEFLAPPKIRTTHSAELFQQQHGPLLSSSAADIRHQHQPDFGIGGASADSDSAYDQIGGPNLIGNLLEQIKPDVDAGPMSHFDQLYTTEVTSSGDARGIDKFITTQAQQAVPDQLPPFLAQKQSTVSISVVSTTGTVGPGGGAGAEGNTSSSNKQQQNGTLSSSSTSSSSAATTTKVISSASSVGIVIGSGGKRPAELQCQKCNQMVVNRSTSLMYHVNVKHLKLPMFKCRSCGEEYLWNKSAAIRHAHRHGGDETLIDNYSERLFPTLNRHRREYFNLAKRGIEDSPTPPLIEKAHDEQDKDADTPPMGTTTREAKRARMTGGGHGDMKREESMDGEEQIVVDDDEEDERTRSGRRTGADGAEKKEQTPNSILAQLVDMTRGGGGAEEKSTTTKSSTHGGGSQQQQQQNGGQQSGTVASTSTASPAEQHTKTTHKSVQCGGCGDLVINQEWIMLNHVNTKHLHLPLYKCVGCNKPFENYLRSYAVRHAKFYHAGDESILLDQREMFLGELRDAGSQLFGVNSNIKVGGGNGAGANE